MVEETDQIQPIFLLRHVKPLCLVGAIQESLLIFVKLYNE